MTCTHTSPGEPACPEPPALAVRTTDSRNQGLKTLIYWDHTDAPKAASVLCNQHGRELIQALAHDLTGGHRFNAPGGT